MRPVALTASLPPPRAMVVPAARLPVLMAPLPSSLASVRAAELLAPLPLMASLSAPPPMVASEWVQQPSVLVEERAVRESVEWPVRESVE
jgi:hypothetical protein